MHFSANVHPLAIPAIADTLTLPVDLLSPPALEHQVLLIHPSLNHYHALHHQSTPTLDQTRFWVSWNVSPKYWCCQILNKPCKPKFLSPMLWRKCRVNFHRGCVLTASAEGSWGCYSAPNPFLIRPEILSFPGRVWYVLYLLKEFCI